ncbi:hypothetical protein [Sinorhizobium psoraleae]|uniref:DUF3606 domain-containing protein n=1 Tax=Sinorhizobium psoraleae TaxID=520838 RepID=A0ABT4KDG3_9HYPH|nr:hypothetical protein [Sinorhizobium psoraleae]MCZ4089988.1 hypothetical protein [Sinorhizobium psoraleae]
MLGNNGKETPNGGFDGRTMTIEAFARKYRLDEDKANRLEDEFGPAAPEVDLLRAARRNGLPEE